MKIISWNIRGLGGKQKRRLIKELLGIESPDLVVLQETKKEDINIKLMGSIWGSRFKEWSFLPSVGRSGGILIVWDVRVFRGIETVLGIYSVSVLLELVNNDKCWWFTGHARLNIEESFGRTWRVCMGCVGISGVWGAILI